MIHFAIHSRLFTNVVFFFLFLEFCRLLIVIMYVIFILIMSVMNPRDMFYCSAFEQLSFFKKYILASHLKSLKPFTTRGHIR